MFEFQFLTIWSGALVYLISQINKSRDEKKKNIYLHKRKYRLQSSVYILSITGLLKFNFQVHGYVLTQYMIIYLQYSILQLQNILDSFLSLFNLALTKETHHGGCAAEAIFAAPQRIAITLSPNYYKKNQRFTTRKNQEEHGPDVM